jgi:hypothetical protein
MAQVTVARGAALAAARSTEFTDEELVAHASEPAAVPAPPRKISYTGAITALAAGAIAFVSSVSVAVGIQLAPETGAASAKHVVHTPTPQIAEAVASAVAPPAEVGSPAPKSQEPTGEPAQQAGVPGEQEGTPAEQQPDPNARQPYLTRVLEHIRGDATDSAPDAPTP